MREAHNHDLLRVKLSVRKAIVLTQDDEVSQKIIQEFISTMLH